MTDAERFQWICDNYWSEGHATDAKPALEYFAFAASDAAGDLRKAIDEAAKKGVTREFAFTVMAG